jgi:hypothetical protein
MFSICCASPTALMPYKSPMTFIVSPSSPTGHPHGEPRAITSPQAAELPIIFLCEPSLSTATNRLPPPPSLLQEGPHPQVVPPRVPLQHRRPRVRAIAMFLPAAVSITAARLLQRAPPPPTPRIGFAVAPSCSLAPPCPANRRQLGRVLVREGIVPYCGFWPG